MTDGDTADASLFETVELLLLSFKMVENSVADTRGVNDIVLVQDLWVVSLQGIISEKPVHLYDTFRDWTLFKLLLFVIGVVEEALRNLW